MMAESQRPKIRKSCDLCYRKRIKCDGQTPRCSQCQLYDSQCTHEAARRRKKPAKSRRDLSSKTTMISNTRSDAVHLSGSSNHTEGEEATYQYPPTPTSQLDLHHGHVVGSPNTSSLNREALFPSSSGSSCGADFLGDAAAAPNQMELPPESVVRQLIDVYLANINSIIPLFDPQQLSCRVNRWYNSPTQRSRISWAVINVVMAMAQYCCNGQVAFGQSDSSIGSVPDCLNKAQSALTEVLMGDPALENLQVVLGLIIVFQSTSDIKPAAFLMSTALRLSQILGIHRSDSECYGNSTAREALQQRRVFWIAYILDRDIAMRIRQKPIQEDADINIELPPNIPDADAAGFVNTPELRQHGFNVFRARVELSQIQGHIYDSLSSVRSQQLSPGERAASGQTIRLLLKDWKDRIPATLRAEALSQSQNYLPFILEFFCTLYGTVITCLGQLCQVNSMDFRWVDQLRHYGRSIGLDQPCLPPPLPQGWNALVNSCREFMPLFTSVQNRGPAFIWTNICPYASGLVCLSANSIINLDNGDNVQSHDQRLKAEAVNVLGDMYRQTNHKTLTRVLEASVELDSQYRFMAAK